MVTAAAIYDEDEADQPLLRLDVHERRATLPAGALPLLPNRRYTLRLVISGRLEPADIIFVGTAPGATGSLVILRLD